MNDILIPMGRNELWAIQSEVKPLVESSDPVRSEVALIKFEDNRPLPSLLTLRRKINRAIIELADDPDKSHAEVPLELEELWLVDSVFSREDGDWAEDFLTRIMRGIESLESGLPWPIISEMDAVERHLTVKE